MTRGPGLVVLYRWRLHARKEKQFVEAWSRITELLRETRGSFGSRLHRGADGLWYGYAQWPSEDVRQRACASSVDAAAGARMREAIAESFPEVLLESVADYLVLPGAEQASQQRVHVLERVTELCLAFPEAERELTGDHATFRVRGKVFAYFLSNHHGDGIVSLCCKVGHRDNEDMARIDPQRFSLPAYIAHHGYVGIRLDRGEPEWEGIAAFARESYCRTAPKTLVAQVTAPKAAPRRTRKST